MPASSPSPRETEADGSIQVNYAYDGDGNLVSETRPLPRYTEEARISFAHLGPASAAPQLVEADDTQFSNGKATMPTSATFGATARWAWSRSARIMCSTTTRTARPPC